jgi:3-deoxy-7-phosphoheptulonate synthase
MRQEVEHLEQGLSLVKRESKPAGTVVEVAGVPIGAGHVVVMAGPCSVESADQLLTTARGVKAAGARLLRGGAFKPRTSPYSFCGLKHEGLKLLAQVKRETGLPVVTEVLDVRQIDSVAEVADILQVGSRHMQSIPLLEAVGESGKPVLLKRGMWARLEEFLWAAEWVASRGNERIILCERGVRGFETATRNTLDLNAVPWLKRHTHFPVIVDPSHGTGHWWMVESMSLAAVAAGADGLLIEVHPEPQHALSDGPQSLRLDKFEQLMEKLAAVARALGRWEA